MKVAAKLGVDIETLRKKGKRLDEKLEQASKKHLREVKTKFEPKKLKIMKDNLLALKIFGGITKVDIPFDIPDDETKLAELEMIFGREYGNLKNVDYDKVAEDNLRRYQKEYNKQKIKELNMKLAGIDEDNDDYLKIVSEINDLQKLVK